LPNLMHLKILLPFGMFVELFDASQIVAETREGSFGLLPHRRDCVSTLMPGILIYQSKSEGECFVAVDQGVLIKTGLDVIASVRNAIAGKDLAQLRERVEREFVDLDQGEAEIRSVMAKMEGSFMCQLAEFHHE